MTERSLSYFLLEAGLDLLNRKCWEEMKGELLCLYCNPPWSVALAMLIPMATERDWYRWGARDALSVATLNQAVSTVSNQLTSCRTEQDRRKMIGVLKWDTGNGEI